MRTVEYLDALKARYALPSDYALAPLLGITRSRMSRYRGGKDFLGDSTAIRVAELLEMSPQKVLADMYAERTKDPAVRRVWQQIARASQAAGMAVFAGVLALGYGLDAGPALAAAVSPVCILC